MIANQRKSTEAYIQWKWSLNSTAERISAIKTISKMTLQQLNKLMQSRVSTDLN